MEIPIDISLLCLFREGTDRTDLWGKVANYSKILASEIFIWACSKLILVSFHDDKNKKIKNKLTYAEVASMYKTVVVVTAIHAPFLRVVRPIFSSPPTSKVKRQSVQTSRCCIRLT